jgi:hypothetical protein
VQGSAGHNRVAGADAVVRFWGSSTFDGWIANTWQSGGASTAAGAIDLNIRPERWYSLAAGFQSVPNGFAPGLGFVRRTDMRRFTGTVAWTPRFEESRWARSLVTALNGEQIDGQDGERQSVSQLLHNMLTFQSGDWLSLNVRRRFERLEAPAPIQGRTLPVGDYVFTAVDVSFRTNESRTLSGRGNASVGNFWSGTRAEYGGGLTWKTGPYLTLTGSASRNDIELPVADGTFSTTILSLDVLGALSRNLFANALVQWDDVSKELLANVRVDWIHTPGSDLFVVLDTGYFTGDLTDPLDPRWLRRTGVVKLTYMKAF